MKRRGRGDGSVRQRPNGLWEASLRYIDPLTSVRRRLSVYGATRSDAVEKLDAARSRLRREQRPAASRVTLGAYLEHWLENVVRPTRRPATYRSYAATILHLEASPLAAHPLRDLQRATLQRTFARWPATRTTELAVVLLRAALTQALDDGLLLVNPALGLKPPRREPAEMRALSPNECRALLRAARGDRLCALYVVAIATGMRRGELFALRWSDVDLRRGVLRVVRSYDPHTATMGPVKTRSGRRQIALAPDTVAALRAHRDRQRLEGLPAELVFAGPEGGPLNPDRVRRGSFLPLQAAAKIAPPVRFHDLRHTAATLMLGAGVHPKIVSERLGHASIGITMDQYQHVAPTMQREAAAKVSRLLGRG